MCQPKQKETNVSEPHWWYSLGMEETEDPPDESDNDDDEMDEDT